MPTPLAAQLSTAAMATLSKLPTVVVEEELERMPTEEAQESPRKSERTQIRHSEERQTIDGLPTKRTGLAVAKCFRLLTHKAAVATLEATLVALLASNHKETSVRQQQKT